MTNKYVFFLAFTDLEVLVSSKLKRVQKDSFFFRLNSLLISCRSFSVLTKELFFFEMLLIET